jgi:hypothetical protein
MHKANQYDLSHLRITSIDGFSERLRFSVNKKITGDMLRQLFVEMARADKPHQIKIYNVCGLPGETEEDWQEFLDDLRMVDETLTPGRQWSIVLHNTPFRPMPATPLACAPASYLNYRGRIARVLGRGKYKGNIFYQGNRFWAVEGMGTDGLSTHILSMICHRGTEEDTDSIEKIAASHKFWRASLAVKRATLEKYFDVKTLFGSFMPDDLPSKYLKTYCAQERMWGDYGKAEGTDRFNQSQKSQTSH